MSKDNRVDNNTVTMEFRAEEIDPIVNLGFLLSTTTHECSFTFLSDIACDISFAFNDAIRSFKCGKLPYASHILLLFGVSKQTIDLIEVDICKIWGDVNEISPDSITWAVV